MALANVVWVDWEAIDEMIDYEMQYDTQHGDHPDDEPFIPLVIERAESALCAGRLPLPWSSSVRTKRGQLIQTGFAWSPRMQYAFCTDHGLTR